MRREVDLHPADNRLVGYATCTSAGGKTYLESKGMDLLGGDGLSRERKI